jgi:DegV family protein with EDD domain
MSAIAVVTDSAANLPLELVEMHHIEVIPLTLIWHGQVYRDGKDISASELYQALRADPGDLPSSSSPSVGEFVRVYSRLAATSDGIVSIHLASGLSATYTAAKHAQSLIENVPIEVVDSRSATMGCGFAVLKAASSAAAGQSLGSVVESAQGIIDRVHVYGVLGSLRYVQRSGRVPAIAAIAGSLLDIHPLLSIERGQAGLLEIQRTKKRALARLLDVVERSAGGGCIRAAVMHAAALDDAEALGLALQDRCDCSEIIVTEFTPVLGSYAGPGLVAVALYCEED